MELTQPDRLETMLAFSLARNWGSGLSCRSDQSEPPEPGNPVDKSHQQAKPADGLPGPLRRLGPADQRTLKALLRSYQKLPAADKRRWLESRLVRVRNTSRERNQRFDRDIHPTQIVEALRDEPPAIQAIIVRSLPDSHAATVAQALNIEVAQPPSEQLATAKIVAVVRQGFFECFVATDTLELATSFDLLSVIELARLIRLLGSRETAIACQMIAAAEVLTAFLKRFSAEDAHAIVSHLNSLPAVGKDRLEFAELIVRQAINAGASDAAVMLDRVGLGLLAIVLETRGPLRRRHIVQKLSIEAARELGQLMSERSPLCNDQIAASVLDEAESLAANLHHQQSANGTERRGSLALPLVC